MENQYDSASQLIREKVTAFVEGPVREELPQLASALLKAANNPKATLFSAKINCNREVLPWTT